MLSLMQSPPMAAITDEIIADVVITSAPISPGRLSPWWITSSPSEVTANDARIGDYQRLLRRGRAGSAPGGGGTMATAPLISDDNNGDDQICDNMTSHSTWG